MCGRVVERRHRYEWATRSGSVRTRVWRWRGPPPLQRPDHPRNLADWIGKPEDEAVGVGTRKTPWPGLAIYWGPAGHSWRAADWVCGSQRASLRAASYRADGKRRHRHAYGSRPTRRCACHRPVGVSHRHLQMIPDLPPGRVLVMTLMTCANSIRGGALVLLSQIRPAPASREKNQVRAARIAA